jgi:hypothetical protein
MRPVPVVRLRLAFSLQLSERERDESSEYFQLSRLCGRKREGRGEEERGGGEGRRRGEEEGGGGGRRREAEVTKGRNEKINKNRGAHTLPSLGGRISARGAGMLLDVECATACII